MTEADKNGFRKDIITAFMMEAKNKIKIRNGLDQHLFPEVVKNSMGLIQTFTAFESFANGKFPVNNATDGIKHFCKEYEDYMEEIYPSLESFIEKIYNEIQKSSLKNMANQNTDGLEINGKKNFEEIFNVMYRVRSNIVHGNKAIDNNRNTLLIENSFKLLYTIFEQVLKNKEYISF
ncbi:MAG: hypothetical protein ACE5ES_05855 [Candidatus Nanoarchaeia archaeon]